MRLKDLDSLRGYCALAVVLYHYLFRYDELYGHTQPVLTQAAFYGQYGVEIFFMISGMVIYWSISRSNSISDFVISRFSRLYPVYWVAGALSFLAVSLFGLPGREVGVWQALLNALMFQGYFRIPYIDGVYWTLQIELTFYFWMGICLLVGNSRYFFNMACTVIFAMSLLKVAQIHVPLPVRQMLIADYIPYFVCGMHLFNRRHGKPYRFATLAYLMSIGYVLAFQTLAESITLALGNVVMWQILFGSGLGWLSNRVTLFLGAISYPLYLIHQNVGYLIIQALEVRGVDAWLAILVAIVVAVMLGALLHYGVEGPLSRSVKRYLLTWRTTRRPSAPPVGP
jgi:peptidoglycan/LPS O-acetylase OafA/YrhL